MNKDTNDNKTFEEMNQEQEEVQEETSSVPSKRIKKERVKKKRRKKYYSIRILIVILVCVLTYLILHSDAFLVKKIEVEKNDRFTVEEIKKLSGLEEGVNMFEIKKGDKIDRLEENPYIREAEIKRQMPDTLIVSLDQRTPVAVVKQKDKYVILDREGYVLDKKEKLPHYTLLDGVSATEAKPGTIVTVKEEKLYRQYMELLDKMIAADLYFREIDIEKNTVKLYVRKKLYCVGTKENIVEGLEDGNLKAVLYRLSKKDTKKGVLSVGDDKYYSFSKSLK